MIKARGFRLTACISTTLTDFEAIDVKALERRINGVVFPADLKQAIWASEVEAQKDAIIYHRLLIDMGLLGDFADKRTAAISQPCPSRIWTGVFRRRRGSN